MILTSDDVKLIPQQKRFAVVPRDGSDRNMSASDCYDTDVVLVCTLVAVPQFESTSFRASHCR